MHIKHQGYESNKSCSVFVSSLNSNTGNGSYEKNEKRMERIMPNPQS